MPMLQDEEGAATGTGEGCINMLRMLFALVVLFVLTPALVSWAGCKFSVVLSLALHLENEGRPQTIIDI